MTDAEKRMRAWCDAQRGGNHKGGCDVCDEVMTQLAKGVCVTSGQVSDAKKVGGSVRTRSGCVCSGRTRDGDTRRSALSHACDLQGVCDAQGTRDDTRDTQLGSETHTNTHTDDASTCKHEGCDE